MLQILLFLLFISHVNLHSLSEAYLKNDTNETFVLQNISENESLEMKYLWGSAHSGDVIKPGEEKKIASIDRSKLKKREDSRYYGVTLGLTINGNTETVVTLEQKVTRGGLFSAKMLYGIDNNWQEKGDMQRNSKNVSGFTIKGKRESSTFGDDIKYIISGSLPKSKKEENKEASQKDEKDITSAEEASRTEQAK